MESNNFIRSAHKAVSFFLSALIFIFASLYSVLLISDSSTYRLFVFIQIGVLLLLSLFLWLSKKPSFGKLLWVWALVSIATYINGKYLNYGNRLVLWVLPHVALIAYSVSSIFSLKRPKKLPNKAIQRWFLISRKLWKGFMDKSVQRDLYLWSRYGRGLQVFLLMGAGIWIWIRNISGIENPERFPMFLWIIISALMISFFLRKYIKPWEAFLGNGAGYLLTILASLAIPLGGFFFVLFVSIFSIVGEYCIQKLITFRIEKR